jgi:hypothetical protein
VPSGRFECFANALKAAALRGSPAGGRLEVNKAAVLHTLLCFAIAMSKMRPALRPRSCGARGNISGALFVP